MAELPKQVREEWLASLAQRLRALTPELGSGSGYGAALASYIVGPEGSVLTVEIDETLARWANRSLASTPNVTVGWGDAVDAVSSVSGVEKIVATFAVSELPSAWLDAIPDGGVLVAPVGPREKDQRLVRVRRVGGELHRSEHGAVRYVQNRSPHGGR